MWSKDSFWLSNDLGYSFVKGGGCCWSWWKIIEMLLFSYTKKIEIQSVGKVLVVVVVIVVVVVVV